MNNILSKEEIISIKACGKILSFSLKNVVSNVVPGISTLKLDQIAYNSITGKGAVPSFLNYEVKGSGRFPASLCVSINDEIVHGIPSKDRILKEGDIVSLDLGVKYKGLCTDMAVTVPVGAISSSAAKLIENTRECLLEGVKMARDGNRIGDIGETVQGIAERDGFAVVRDLVGHGIGRNPHMPPHVPNFRTKDMGPRIVEGMALAIEPMITAGSHKIKIKNDCWTVVTADGSLSAHFEHTVVIENGLPTIVTL